MSESAQYSRYVNDMANEDRLGGRAMFTTIGAMLLTTGAMAVADRVLKGDAQIAMRVAGIALLAVEACVGGREIVRHGLERAKNEVRAIQQWHRDAGFARANPNLPGTINTGLASDKLDYC
jgi:hypothetical protein